MFNVKRIGSTVEITQIPREVSIDVFKEIAAQTEANECLICFSKDSDNYEVIIRHDNANMAGAIAWLALETRVPVKGDADISTLGKRIGVMRVKRHMSAQELEEAIGAPEGSVFRWEIGKQKPSEMDIAILADVLKCSKEWLQGGELRYKSISSKELSKIPGYLIDASANALGVLMNEYKIKEREPAIELALVVRSAFTTLIT
ncbi:helix-turn-helix domain-containing protein [Citrobacter meridianamericanus]|uniref:helix-turn-helix domain-containing protein n=1 Tax=Citrobacter meridianamericanus TaxID=2894201 RepID=UPI00351CFE1E